MNVKNFSILSLTEIQYMLKNMLEESPVESGQIHPADDFLSNLAKDHPSYIEIIYSLIYNYPNSRPDIFKLIGRLDSKYFNNLSFHRLLKNFLKDENVEVVDSIVGIFESISNKKILKDWLETNPSHPQWLLDYANQVANQDSSL